MTLDKEFWLRLQNKYELSGYKYFCKVSREFQLDWGSNDGFHNMVIALAHQFKEEVNLGYNFRIGDAFLFDTEYDEDERHVRIEFLDWVISKLID